MKKWCIKNFTIELELEFNYLYKYSTKKRTFLSSSIQNKFKFYSLANLSYSLTNQVLFSIPIKYLEESFEKNGTSKWYPEL